MKTTRVAITVEEDAVLDLIRSQVKNVLRNDEAIKASIDEVQDQMK